MSHSVSYLIGGEVLLAIGASQVVHDRCILATHDRLEDGVSIGEHSERSSCAVLIVIDYIVNVVADLLCVYQPLCRKRVIALSCES